LGMKTNHVMQTNLCAKATAALLLFIGLVAQVHGQALFFKDDPRKTTNTFKPLLVVPTTTNTVEAKVIVVNRYDQTFTIEHGGKLHLFRVYPGTALFNAKGKPTTLDWVTAGQTVLLQVEERPSGSWDLLTANILPNRQQFQAAGKKKKEVAPAPEPAVFPSEDARPSVTEETPLPVEAPATPTPTDEVKPEPAPENPQPQNESEPKL
jgi:hypothetical protein